jgi:hypothetical protein
VKISFGIQHPGFQKVLNKRTSTRTAEVWDDGLLSHRAAMSHRRSVFTWRISFTTLMAGRNSVFARDGPGGTSREICFGSWVCHFQHVAFPFLSKRWANGVSMPAPRSRRSHSNRAPSCIASEIVRFGLVRHVTFESGPRLASIGNAAFSECLSLRSVCLPSSVIEFGDNSFGKRTGVRVDVKQGTQISSMDRSHERMELLACTKRHGFVFLWHSLGKSRASKRQHRCLFPSS